MKQREAVAKVMEENGGYATLGFLNQNVLKTKNCEWKTKTPFASIRRIVQDERFFFKIKPGLWALKIYKDKLPIHILSAKKISKKKQEKFDHTYYQGLLVEIGNSKKFETFVPYQDKNKEFLGKNLGNVATMKRFYEFGYKNIIDRAITVDVSWFNKRKMPSSFFEVEHSTSIQNSLLKFVDLQDFRINFFIVADKIRKREFENKIRFSAFASVRERVQFMNYDDLSDLHAKTFEISSFENKFNF